MAGTESTLIGKALRAARESRGLTLAELSSRSGVAVANLSRIERGLADPRLSTLERICDALDIRLSLAPAGAQPTTLAAIRARAARGRDRLNALELASPSPRSRIARRAAAGEDVRDEMEWLAGFEATTS